METTKEYFYTLTTCSGNKYTTTHGSIIIGDGDKSLKNIYNSLMSKQIPNSVCINWTISPNIISNDYAYIITWNDGQDIQTESGIEQGITRTEIFEKVKARCICVPGYTPRILFWSLDKNLL
jgi:hypothetical protein